MNDFSLWYTENRERLFLLPDQPPHPAGTLRVREMTGRESSVAEDWAAAYELTDAQARRWAQHELGDTLEQLKGGLDVAFVALRRRIHADSRAPENADVAPALLEILKSLPGVIGNSLSGDAQRLGSARDTMGRIQQRLNAAGIDVDDRVKNFADRLASIRTEAEATKPPDDSA